MKHFYIGDIHGYANHLEIILEEIKHLEGPDAVVNFMGDLVDRGPDTKRVLDLVIGAKKYWKKCFFHLGNHDQKFRSIIKFGANSPDYNNFVKYGGAETLQSYSVSDDTVQSIAQLYPQHITLLNNAILYRQQGCFISAHAGIDFDMPVETQTEGTLCWIRNDFLNHIDASAPVVIHGHTIVGEQPVITENRISIDTGVYKSGLLTCCVIDGQTKLNFFQTDGKTIFLVKPVVIDRGQGTLFQRSDLKI